MRSKAAGWRHQADRCGLVLRQGKSTSLGCDDRRRPAGGNTDNITVRVTTDCRIRMCTAQTADLSCTSLYASSQQEARSKRGRGAPSPYISDPSRRLAKISFKMTEAASTTSHTLAPHLLRGVFHPRSMVGFQRLGAVASVLGP